jgi:hypothetical protein
MNRNIPPNFLRLYRNMSILADKFEIEAARKVAANPNFIKDVANYDPGCPTRCCDACFGVGFVHMFSEVGVAPADDSVEICPPCLVKLQAGLLPCQSIIEAHLYDRRVQCEKMLNGVFCSATGVEGELCSNCATRTKSIFRESDRVLCPVCFTIVNNGSLFVEDVVPIMERLFEAAFSQPTDPRHSIMLDVMEEFLNIWDGQGVWSDELRAWIQQVHPELLPQQQNVVINGTQQLDANTSSIA